ncbi:hypothetical protein AMATHDRAFT_3942 [Amanita thiersii Skay4041]|uniref:Uncharacterized protein n=1 Tax=Amanita thiersii Skay4041 TaxID=703135 RepID=A0A2A9NHJ7_9AGAR|nr:hypothetical protein AMATHDRAFT_3942 [Amanita thiersii Skay4041]
MDSKSLVWIPLLLLATSCLDSAIKSPNPPVSVKDGAVVASLNEKGLRSLLSVTPVIRQVFWSATLAEAAVVVAGAFPSMSISKKSDGMRTHPDRIVCTQTVLLRAWKTLHARTQHTEGPRADNNRTVQYCSAPKLHGCYPEQHGCDWVVWGEGLMGARIWVGGYVSWEDSCLCHVHTPVDGWYGGGVGKDKGRGKNA